MNVLRILLTEDIYIYLMNSVSGVFTVTHGDNYINTINNIRTFSCICVKSHRITY